jgi:hypothetical protein
MYRNNVRIVSDTLSTESVVINDFYSKTGAGDGAEQVLSGC